MYDAVFVPGGRESVDALMEQGDAKHFVAKAFEHEKPIATLGDGVELLHQVKLPDIELSDEERGLVSEQGIVIDRAAADVDAFSDAFATR